MNIFRNEEVFDPSYIPDVFIYREGQMAALASCLRPIMRNSKPLNAFLFGNPATGKTTVLKITMQQIGEHTNAVIVYINCSNTTTYRIVSEIHKSIIGYLPPETGVPIAKLRDTIFTKLSKEKRVLVVFLDDVYDIKSIEEPLYIILRAYEHYKYAKTCVVITSTKNEIHKLDNRIRSSFMPEVIPFMPYTQQQITSILKQRTDVGLAPNVVSMTILKSIATEAVDVRQAIEMLRAAALRAENEGKIRMSHIQLINTQPVLDPSETLILNVVKCFPDSGLAFQQLKDKLSYSKFYRILTKLESKGLIRTQEIKKGRGKSRRITVV